MQYLTMQVHFNELLDNSSPGKWNVGLVRHIFLPFYANLILNILLFLHGVLTICYGVVLGIGCLASKQLM